MDQLWTSAEKAAFLAAYAAARTETDRTSLRMPFGLTEPVIARWRVEETAGTLADDEPAPEHQGDQVGRLARLFSDLITRGQSKEVIRPLTLAGHVVLDDAGRWRADHLARTRAALEFIFAVVERDPEAFVTPNRPVSAADAVAAVRAHWGIDRFPVLVGAERLNPHTPASHATPQKFADRETRMRTIRRWSHSIFGNAEAAVALDQWLRDAPAARTTAPPVHQQVWSAPDPASWPPPDEAAYLTAIARGHLGELEELANLGDDRHLRVLRRRATSLITEYTSSIDDWASLTGFLTVSVIRPWLPSSLLPYEENEDDVPDRWTRQPRLAAAAISALCLYRAIREWDGAAMQIAVSTERRHIVERTDVRAPTGAGAVDDSAPEPRRSGSARSAAELLDAPRRTQVTNPLLPVFVRGATQAAQELFTRAQQIAQAKHPVFVSRYLRWRTQLTPHTMPPISRRVVVLADYIAGLSASSREVRTLLSPDDRLALRTALTESALADGNAYGMANARNDALEAQSSAPERALDLAWDGLASGPTGEGVTPASARQIREMRQQFALVMAGTATQIVEQDLSLSLDTLVRIRERGRYDEVVARVDRNVRRAYRYANEAVDLIARLVEDTKEMSGPRYIDGHLADKSFVLTAQLYYYRAACAGATAQAVFQLSRDIDFDEMLIAGHERLTTVPDDYPSASLARAIQAMLWHTFLNERRLPALPENANPVLAKLDPIARTSSRDRLIDKRRLKDLTQKLVDLGWDAGALGGFPAGSPTWQHLDWASSMMYGEWRKEWGMRVEPRPE